MKPLHQFAAFAAASIMTMGFSAPSDAADTGQHPAFGWVQGTCLAAASGDLPAGTALAITEDGNFAKPNKAVITGRAPSADVCPIMIDGRSATIDDRPATLYLISPWAKEPMATGVAMIAASGSNEADLAKDVQDFTATQCATSESIRFEVWRGPARQGEPVWSATYGLDYDVEPTCP